LSNQLRADVVVTATATANSGSSNGFGVGIKHWQLALFY
jgi:hypothetical protein